MIDTSLKMAELGDDAYTSIKTSIKSGPDKIGSTEKKGGNKSYVLDRKQLTYRFYEFQKQDGKKVFGYVMLMLPALTS